MNKNWLIGCSIASVLGIAVCAGVGFLVYGVFTLTQPVVDATQEFLALLGQGKLAEAYASTASGYRARQDEASFTLGVKQLGLTDYASASWHNRSIKNLEGSVEGAVTNKAGGTTPVSIQLVKEDGKWKVVGVRYAGIELVTIKAPTPMPADAELRRMTLEALLDFNQAVKAKDFAPFHDKLSETLKKQTSAQSLQKDFQEFIDKNIDIEAVKNVGPLFAPVPALNDKGVLVIAGHYPTEPLPVRFNLQYSHEAGGWKLQGITVNVGKK